MQQRDKGDYTSISIKKEDRKYLMGLKSKMHLSGVWAVVSSIIKMIKELKLEGEMK